MVCVWGENEEVVEVGPLDVERERELGLGWTGSRCFAWLGRRRHHVVMSE